MAKEIAAAAMGKYHYIPKVRHSTVRKFEHLEVGNLESGRVQHPGDLVVGSGEGRI
jgi:hypothetical protein